MKNIDKRIIDKGFHTGYEVDFVTIQQSDYEYLKEQAERVQELEGDNEYLRDVFISFLQANVAELERQNKRYREKVNVALSMLRGTGSDDIKVNNTECFLSEALEGEK